MMADPSLERHFERILRRLDDVEQEAKSMRNDIVDLKIARAKSDARLSLVVGVAAFVAYFLADVVKGFLL